MVYREEGCFNLLEYVKLSRLEPEVKVADMCGSLFDDSDKDTKTPILFFR
jgi:hypothetical protein